MDQINQVYRAHFLGVEYPGCDSPMPKQTWEKLRKTFPGEKPTLAQLKELGWSVKLVTTRKQMPEEIPQGYEFKESTIAWPLVVLITLMIGTATVLLFAAD